MGIKSQINNIQKGQDLTHEESFAMQEQLITGRVSSTEMLSLFSAFEKKNITEIELLGIVTATRKHMITLNCNLDVLDTCGTGGDGLQTFNISTAAAFICAGAGIPVAKHGNRAASSKCGSADVLEALGVNINLDVIGAKKCLDRCRIVFLFAPNFHPALKHVREARLKFGRKTYFNLIGPLLNPARAKYQTIGVADIAKAALMGKVLIDSGSKRVMIVQGSGGMDEVSIFGKSKIFEFYPDKPSKNYSLDPADFDMADYSVQNIKGGTAEINAKILRNILAGNAILPQMNAALINAACGIMTFGKTQTIKEGIELAKEAVESGKALQKLNELIRVSNKIL